MLSEEKKVKAEKWLQGNWSIPMLSQDITLLLYPVIPSCGDLVLDHPNMFAIFLLEVDNVTS